MIYKVPCPTNTNGIKLLKMGDQIAVEYQTGEPNVTMSYDSVLGKSAHTVSFKPKRKAYGRDDLPSGTGIARSKSEMSPRGSTTINDEEEDDDNSQAVVGKVMAFLKDLISDEDLERVAAILGGADEEDADDGRRDAADRRRRRLAGDAARYRLPTPAEDAEFNALFPSARLLKLR
jgi:hypothetical protein